MEYDEKIPKYEELVKFIDNFLNKDVPKSLVTWSEKAKKDRKRTFAMQKKSPKKAKEGDAKNDLETEEFDAAHKQLQKCELTEAALA